MQKVLAMTTKGGDLRSDVDECSMEDGDLVVWSSSRYPDAPIGLTPSPTGKYWPKTPLHALADGWKLLAPPATVKNDDGSVYRNDDGSTYYTWWFVRDEW